MITLENKCADHEINNLVLNGGVDLGWPIHDILVKPRHGKDESRGTLYWFELSLGHGRFAFGQSIGLMASLFGLSLIHI